MPVDLQTSRLPASNVGDIEYVRENYTILRPESFELVEAGVLPQPTYVLPGGTPMVPRDHRRLLEDTGGIASAVGPEFQQRFIAAGGNPADLEEEYSAWLTGIYGACLYSATPEAMVAKGGLMAAIYALTLRPEPEAPDWSAALRGTVDALDSLVRPFTQFDRQRAGGSVSRDRLITAVRDRFPELWSEVHTTPA